MHHSADELRAFGMTDDMIEDQEWYALFSEMMARVLTVSTWVWTA